MRGFKLHPRDYGLFPKDPAAYPLYEVIAEAGLPAPFHSRQTGVGSGQRGGGGIRLKYSHPLHLDDVAVDFPDMPIITAHPSVPWQDEVLAVAEHRPQVYTCLSGWSPEYSPPQLVAQANSLLKEKVLFGCDFPALFPRWLADFAELGGRGAPGRARRVSRRRPPPRWPACQADRRHACRNHRYPTGRDAMNDAVQIYRDVMIPMRDGVRLAADVYRPPGSDALPAVLVRTAYDKGLPEFGPDGFARLARTGFVVVVQDKRGRYASEGEYRVLRDDGQGLHRDGQDTVEWVGTQPWCTGAVGMFGVSYPGQNVLGAAVTAPPHLLAGVPIQPSSDEFTDRSFLDGVLITGMGTWAAIPEVSEDLIAKLPDERRAAARAELEAYFAGLPDGAAATPPTEQPFLRLFPHAWADALTHRDDPEYFAESRFGKAEAARIEVPLLHVGGWLDFFIRNTVRQYALTSEMAHPAVRDAQRLVVGPWTHAVFGSDMIAGRLFPGAAIDELAMVGEWLGRWLRGDVPDGSDRRVLLYVLGANRWRAEESWPLPGGTRRTLSLTAGGQLTPAEAASGTRSFSYDPADPYRGPALADVGAADLTDRHGERVLVFDTDPVDSELEITGVPEVVLHMSTTATDADWHVELHILDADGTGMFVNEGVVRARYRHSRSAPAAVEPGTVETYRVEVRPMSAVVPVNGRLRLLLTAGKYPAFERNPQVYLDLNMVTEGDFRSAVHTVHTGPGLSHVVLPVVRPELRGEWIDNPWPVTEMDDVLTEEWSAAELPG